MPMLIDILTLNSTKEKKLNSVNFSILSIRSND